VVWAAGALSRNGSLPSQQILSNRAGGESPMVQTASALPQNGRLPAMGGRGNVGCPMLRQQKSPQIALVNCYIDLPPLNEFDQTERVGSCP